MTSICGNYSEMPSSCLGPALCFLLHTSRHILSCYPHPLRFNVMSVDLYTLYSFHFQLTPLHLHLHFLQSPVVPSPLLSPCPLCLLSSQVGSIGCYHVTPKPGFHFHVFIFIYHCHATCFFRTWSCNVGVLPVYLNYMLLIYSRWCDLERFAV